MMNNQNILVDSHCHLDMLEDIDAVVARAQETGVKYLQTICTKFEEAEKILSIADKYKNVFASIGVHPSETRKVFNADELIALCQHKKVIGLGETGLDYNYNTDPGQQKLQRDSFEQHIFASQETGLPVIVHMREAEDDSLDMLASNFRSKEFPILIHCFTASQEFATKILDIGGYISISGIVTFKNATSLQSVVQYLPLDRILLETDAPYLAPAPNRGKVNEPSYLHYIAKFIADLKSLDTNTICSATTHNFQNLFNLPDLV